MQKNAACNNLAKERVATTVCFNVEGIVKG